MEKTEHKELSLLQRDHLEKRRVHVCVLPEMQESVFLAMLKEIKSHNHECRESMERWKTLKSFKWS